MNLVWIALLLILILTGCQGAGSGLPPSTQATGGMASPSQATVGTATVAPSLPVTLAPAPTRRIIPTPTPVNPDDLLARSKAAIDQLQSLQMQISYVRFERQKPENLRKGRSLADSSGWMIEASILPGDKTYGVFSREDYTYEFITTSPFELYTKYPGDALWEKSGPVSAPLDYLSQFNLPEFTSSATILGEQVYDSVFCYVVGFTIDLSPYFRENFDQYVSLWDGSAISGSGKVWIGKQDSLIYKVSLILQRDWSYQFEEIYLDFLLREFNQPLNLSEPLPTIVQQSALLESGIYDVAVSPDDTTVAASDGVQNLFVWSSGDLAEPRFQIKNPDQTGEYGVSYNGLAFSPDGMALAAGSRSLVYLFDTADLAAEPRALPVTPDQAGEPVEIVLVAFSPDGKLLAAGGADGRLYVWNTAQFEAEAQTLDGHSAEISGLVFTPDSGRLITGDRDGKITVRDTRQLSRPVRVIADTPGSVSALVVTPDGEQLLAAFPESAVFSWSLDHLAQPPVELMPEFHRTALDRRRRQMINGGGGPSDTQITDLAYSPDGKYLAVCRDSSQVRLFLSEDLSTPYSVLHDAGYLMCSALAFSADGRFIVSGSGSENADGGLSTWTFQDGE